MKKHEFSISIPEACNENWNKMQETKHGRHCSSCSKTVIDFTTMNSDEVGRFMYENPNTCGRFYNTQLENSFQVSTNEKYSLAKFAFACVFVFGISLFSFSKDIETPHSNLIELLENNESLNNTATYEIFSTNPGDSSKTENEKSTEESTFSEEDLLLLPEIEIVGRENIIHCSTITMGVPIKVYRVEEVEIEEEELKIEDGVNIYPNPCSINTAIEYTPVTIVDRNIKLTAAIYNAMGQLIQRHQLRLQDDKFFKQIDTKELNTGVYFIVLNYNNTITKRKLVVRN